MPTLRSFLEPFRTVKAIPDIEVCSSRFPSASRSQREASIGRFIVTGNPREAAYPKTNFLLGQAIQERVLLVRAFELCATFQEMAKKGSPQFAPVRLDGVVKWNFSIPCAGTEQARTLRLESGEENNKKRLLIPSSNPDPRNRFEVNPSDPC
jgi:hypothetical protein